MLTLILLAVTFGLGFGIIVTVFVRIARKTEAQKAYCIAKGYARALGGKLERTPPFPLFARGHTQRLAQSFRGTLGARPFIAYEYQTIAGNGDQQSTTTTTVVQFDSEAGGLPAFTLSPDGILTKLGEMFSDGGEIVLFADDPDFDQAYRLRADRADEVRAVFTPERRRALIAWKKQHLAANRDLFLWCQSGGFPTADKLDAMLASADRARGLFQA